MKINYVYVIYYVDYFFVICYCDEVDEFLVIVWCYYDEENKIEILYRKIYCKLYIVLILFILLYFYNFDEDCMYFIVIIIDCNMEVFDNEFMDYYYLLIVFENLKSLWFLKRLCDVILEVGFVKFYVWFKIIYIYIC